MIYIGVVSLEKEFMQRIYIILDGKTIEMIYERHPFICTVSALYCFMPCYISFVILLKEVSKIWISLERNNPDQEDSPHENKYHIETINMDVVVTHVLPRLDSDAQVYLHR